ncbi:MAG: hypothetical protein GY855_12175, partial [candidate division Zixibacteria bacterium]|nr:hypothetical protein [candidate division Zixibacteria bacterium]
MSTVHVESTRGKFLKYFIIFVGIVFIIFSTSNARIINVPDDYLTIQEGINASSNGDTVLVQPDTYYENINFDEYEIVLGSLFLTTGDEGYISSTIIDGNDLDRVVTQSGPSMLKGFTIQNGLSDVGSGIRCYNGAKIYNNIIKHNFADGEDFTEKGAGIFCSGYAEIIDNIITNNVSNYHAGGIYCLGGSTLIEGNTISNNRGPYACGGIYCRGSDATIRNNLILNNWSEEGPGGGIYCNESNPTIESNIICH